MKDKEIPALLRVKLWLGLQAEEEYWHKSQTEGELAVFAETVSSLPLRKGWWWWGGELLYTPLFEGWKIQSETRMTASTLKQNPNLLVINDFIMS